MHVSGYDIIKALIECREKYNPQKVAICGFSEVLYEAANICNIIGVNANVYNPVNNADLAKAVNNALQDGCDAIVGGYSINLIAQKMGINSVVVKSGQESIAQAMNEAIFTVERIRQERIKAQMYKTIIYSTDSGLLYVNTNGVIQVANHAVRHMTGCDNLKDKALKEEIPWLYELYEEVICSEKHGNRLILVPHTKMMVSVKCTPVVANKEISGTVINIKDVTQIQELEKQIRKELSEKGLNTRYRFEDIIHQSRTIDRVIEQARKYAASDSNVIILGETGTGKEIFAQSIHNVSNRKKGPFVAINCAALPENLLESELFGYVDGAFTGANKGGKIGLFEMAHKGTLFLDEIGEISPAIGLCTSIKNMKVALDIGFDYVVLSGTEISALDEDSFTALEYEVATHKIKINAFNGLCPKEIDMVGPRYSEEISRGYLSRLAARGARLGVKNLGIGAPNSRHVPKGYDRRQAWSNGKKIISIAAEEAAKYQMVASIESLTYKYCNFINTLEESLIMSEEIAKENVPIIIDFFHMEADGVAIEAAFDYIRFAYDIHISGMCEENKLITRPFVDESYDANLREIASLLHNAGYNRTVTLEPDAVSEGFEMRAESALKEMRKSLCCDY